ncbi:innexin [Hyalella azteca]|uniref:Innexin n=1 Tax=Hyalella azteca TaxID=294128 RepID=A0A6A0H7K6_HYAAZ|nr:innexin [Hyalella azteca]
MADDVVNTYCWIHTTFTIPRYLHGNGPSPYPGVGLATPTEEITRHAYYQWVPFMLVFQGVLFYVPHLLWKTWEGKTIQSITAGLSAPIIPSKDKKENLDLLREYLTVSFNSHNLYAFKFLFCEGLNLINVALQMLLLDKFLGGAFLTYGMDVLNFTELDQSQRTDPMIEVFPRVTKCSFHMFGPSGSVETHDLMCILALNVINEKIFVFLWFWFVLLIILSFISFLYRALLFCVPAVRKGLLLRRSNLKFKSTLNTLGSYLLYGDYFILYLVSKNVDIMAFTELLEDLAAESRGARNPSAGFPEMVPLQAVGEDEKPGTNFPSKEEVV